VTAVAGPAPFERLRRPCGFFPGETALVDLRVGRCGRRDGLGVLAVRHDPFARQPREHDLRGDVHIAVGGMERTGPQGRRQGTGREDLPPHARGLPRELERRALPQIVPFQPQTVDAGGQVHGPAVIVHGTVVCPVVNQQLAVEPESNAVVAGRDERVRVGQGDLQVGRPAPGDGIAEQADNRAGAPEVKDLILKLHRGRRARDGPIGEVLGPHAAAKLGFPGTYLCHGRPRLACRFRDAPRARLPSPRGAN
jgi:hypothetical protein